jgi:glycosyltransferase involved in cell wall biosynthesis
MFTILHTESSPGWGGQEIRIIQESLGMIKRGHKVVIAAPKINPIFRKAADLGISTVNLEFQKSSPVSLFNVLRMINKYKFDIANTHSSPDSWITTCAAKLSGRGTKVIRTRHLSTSISASPLSRILYSLPAAIITTGEAIRERMIRVNGYDGNKIVSIPTGVDINRFDSEKTVPCLDKKGFTVGTISVLRSWKGHTFLLKAIPDILKAIPDAVFYIAGTGPQFENIKGLIGSMSLEGKVLMLGHREDVPEIMASLDVLVHPSYSNEGVPQSLLQALAMKKAVVASDAGAIKEVVIDGKTGFLTMPGNPGELAERVIELYKNPWLRAEFGREGRKLIEENYSLDKMLDRIESLYDSLLYGKAYPPNVRK